MLPGKLIAATALGTLIFGGDKMEQFEPTLAEPAFDEETPSRLTKGQGQLRL